LCVRPRLGAASRLDCDDARLPAPGQGVTVGAGIAAGSGSMRPVARPAASRLGTPAIVHWTGNRAENRGHVLAVLKYYRHDHRGRRLIGNDLVTWPQLLMSRAFFSMHQSDQCVVIMLRRNICASNWHCGGKE